MTDKLTLASDKPLDQQASAASQDDPSEDRMRRALEQLGGGSSPGRPHHPAAAASAHEGFAATRKHRFVQDGDVQVTHVQGRRDRGSRTASPSPTGAPAAFAPEAKLNMAQDALAEERGLRQRAERAAQEAQAMIATLQTKLGHNEIALGEARDAVQSHAETTAKLQAELQLHDEQIKLLQAKLSTSEEKRQRLDEALHAERLMIQPHDNPAIKPPAPKIAAARKSSRPTRSVAQSQKARDPNAEEPQPVKWWLGKKQ